MSITKKEEKARMMYVFYLVLHQNIKEKFKEESIKITAIEKHITSANRIPKKYAALIIEEMCCINLLEHTNRYEVRILENNEIENISKLYHELGLW